MEITIEKILDLIKDYKQEDKDEIKKAYELAKKLHSGQKRESGEDYIIHPLNVAYILAELRVDKDTICAGLLHDTIEDTGITKEDIEKEFNKHIAFLVDGVSKISRMNFSNKNEERLANTRKIITSIIGDIRTIIIKLADRLHNMRTLEYKQVAKQKENAFETLEIYVPLAYYIGEYRIKTELEDLSFKYLQPDTYKIIEEERNVIEKNNKWFLSEMLYNLKTELNEKNISNEMKFRTKNIYGIYKRLKFVNRIENIHDLFSLKVMVDEIMQCYETLGIIHLKYHMVEGRFKDYISNPKTNMYRSLHSTIYGPKKLLVQTQIRTFDMDKIASFGLPAYWNLKKEGSRYNMQKELRKKFQFMESLSAIDKMFKDNEKFIKAVKNELLSDNVYIYTDTGETIELPIGSTIVDFACRIDENIIDKLVEVFVNEQPVSLDYQLQNKDRVKMKVSEISKTSKEELLSKANTTYARQKILRM